jgi:hypothetical protein
MTAAELGVDPALIVREGPRYVATLNPGDRFETWHCRECGGACDHSESCGIGQVDAARDARDHAAPASVDG